MKNKFVMVDIESDGPIPHLYSMVSFGAVVVEDPIVRTFSAKLKPISENYLEEALKVSGYTRELCLTFEDPKAEMERFDKWLSEKCADFRPIFVSDNNGFDWQFINYYFHRFVGRNPFGYSSTNLGSLYKGMVKDLRKNFKHLRKTKHDHDPLNDATGNAEAMNCILKNF